MYTAPQEIVRLVRQQAHLLHEIATGLERSFELEELYREQGRALDIALIPYRLAAPFPFPSLAAWVAECQLRYPTRRARLAAIDGLVEGFCRQLDQAVPVDPAAAANQPLGRRIAG